MGLHEAPYLPNNDSSLLSTNQAREAGIWVADVLKRHGGDQRLVAPLEDSRGHTSNKMVSIDLDVQDRLLCIKCEYPMEEEFNSLPQIWFMHNKQPWKPEILDSNKSVIVHPC